MKFSKLIKCLSLVAIMSFSVNSFAVTNDIIVYFSASGNTKIVARALAKKLDAQDLAIEAKQVYTNDDLNYRQDNCRANVEMKTPDARPEIANDLSAVNDKENVYLGFPIWWGTAPRIIQTFIEETEKNRNRMESAIRATDVDGIAGMAHKLLPLFTLLGASEALPLLLWLEQRRGEAVSDEMIQKANEALRQVDIVMAEARRYAAGD